MRVGITGANGLIGRHVGSYFQKKLGKSPALATRQTFSDPAALSRFFHDCDVVIHLAGVNREMNKDHFSDNVKLAEQVVDQLKTRTGITLIFASSIQVTEHGAYGESKKQAAEVFRKWAAQSAGKNTFVNAILPHIFGEYGKPNHNSVISTFSYQIAHQIKPAVHTDKKLELLHAMQLAKLFHSWILEKKKPEEMRVSGQPLLVSEALGHLQRLETVYRSGADLRGLSILDRNLLLTLRSFLPHEFYPLYPPAVATTPHSLKSGEKRILDTNLEHLIRVTLVSGQAKIKLISPLATFPLLPTWTFPGKKPGESFDIPTHYRAEIVALSDCQLIWNEAPV